MHIRLTAKKISLKIVLIFNLLSRDSFPAYVQNDIKI